jgi:hypothetical protein
VHARRTAGLGHVVTIPESQGYIATQTPDPQRWPDAHCELEEHVQ